MKFKSPFQIVSYQHETISLENDELTSYPRSKKESVPLRWTPQGYVCDTADYPVLREHHYKKHKKPIHDFIDGILCKRRK